AQLLVRDRTWLPPTPNEVLTLIRDPQKHFVQNGDQLLAVLMETLSNLQHELRTQETPSVLDLWNETNLSVLTKVARKQITTDVDLSENSKVVYTPKSEGHFSDYVKRYLNRELQDRRII